MANSSRSGILPKTGIHRSSLDRRGQLATRFASCFRHRRLGCVTAHGWARRYEALLEAAGGCWRRCPSPSMSQPPGVRSPHLLRPLLPRLVQRAPPSVGRQPSPTRAGRNSRACLERCAAFPRVANAGVCLCQAPALWLAQPRGALNTLAGTRMHSSCLACQRIEQRANTFSHHEQVTCSSPQRTVLS